LHTQLDGTNPEPQLSVSSYLRQSELSEELLHTLSCLEPFGQNNPQPIFAIKDVRLFGIRKVGTQHLSFRLGASYRDSTRGIYWNGIHHSPPENEPVDIAVKADWNEYRGMKSLQVTLLDWKPA